MAESSADHVRTFSSTEELIDSAAGYWADLVRHRPPSALFLIALSGGRTASDLFKAFVRKVADGADRFGGVHFFWADERCVPPDHPESNYALARAHLLAPLNIPEAQVHRIRGEVSPVEAARQAEAEFREVSVPAGQVLDLALLGMGEDGHTASLFPGGPMGEGKLFLEVVAPKPPPQRVTMSLPLLSSARNALVLISGRGKEEALRRSLSGNAGPDPTPLGRMIANREETEVWADFGLGGVGG